MTCPSRYSGPSPLTSFPPPPLNQITLAAFSPLVARFSTAPAPQVSTPSAISTQYQDEHNDLVDNYGDPTRRAYTYFVVGGSRFIWASIGRLAVLKLLSSWGASADVLALASVEVDIGNIAPGQLVTLKWRGKPVFIKHRTDDEIADAAAVDLSTLRDPEHDSVRYKKSNILILLGVCTHLGCVPIGNSGDYAGGWFCPCHGSHYDCSGRIRKGPAPKNLEVPEYKFTEGSKVVIG
jgi:ubiquinol-cytochrome c reductase iron-sulfur subunit